MVQHCGLLLFILLVSNVSAQDERFYRQMLTGKLPELASDFKEVTVTPIGLSGPEYRVDLNGDGLHESLQSSKQDGLDVLSVFDSGKQKVFEAKLLAMGAESTLYKIRMVSLSKTSKALILFLDEGFTRGRRFESTARIYLLTYDNDDLKTLTLTEGPHFFHEREAQRDQYWRRDFRVDLPDLNQDGTREVVVHYHHIQRIMLYQGKGKWLRF